MIRCRAISAGGVIAGLIALFFLSVLFVVGDPVQTIAYNTGSQLGGTKDILDLNLSNWRLAIPLMLFIIMLQIFQQGRRTDTREQYGGGY
jgi:hypothetical protein